MKPYQLLSLRVGGPESNGNEELLHTSSELQNKSLTMRGILVAYPEHSFFNQGSYLSSRDSVL